MVNLNVNALNPAVHLVIGLIFLGLAIFSFSKDKGLNFFAFFMLGASSTVVIPISITELLTSWGYADPSTVNFNLPLMIMFFTIITLARLAIVARKKIDFF
ncbi:MAG: hypothetical protein QG594_417 [Bacteroidota bacterium]|jgi:hypothetical protein|nr:hypothetical protein [Bacteroidota bacterium]